MINLIGILLGSISTEATVKVLLRGVIFETPRNWIYSKISENNFFGKLIRCPYCTSFWVSAALIGTYFLSLGLFWLYISWTCICRLSNIAHDISDKIYYSQYGTGVEK